MATQINITMSKKLFNPAFYPYLFDYSQRYNIYYGGRASGKSYFIADKLVLKAAKEKRMILFVNKTAAGLEHGLYKLVYESVEKFGLLPYCKINKSTYTITLPNGSILLCKGLDDSEKAKGITGLTDIYIDEANKLSYEEFHALDLTLRHATAQNQQIYLSYNPVSKANWVYLYWHKDGERERTFYMKSTYKDNLHCAPDTAQAIEDLKITNPALYTIEGLGEFGSLDKLVFSYWREYDGEIPPNLKLLIGLDFGYVNDATAFIVSYLDEPNKKIYVVDEHYEKGMRNEDIAKMIVYKGYGKEIIIADSAEQKSIDTIRDYGARKIKPATKGKGSVIQGIDKLKSYELLVNPKCENTIEELKYYAWKKDKQTNEYINEPIDDFNHCLDALRYSLQCVNEVKKLQSSSVAF